MRSQAKGNLPFAEGTVQTQPLRVYVMGEAVSPVSFAYGIAAGDLSDGESCLVYIGDGEYVVVAVWQTAAENEITESEYGGT